MLLQGHALLQQSQQWHLAQSHSVEPWSPLHTSAEATPLPIQSSSIFCSSSCRMHVPPVLSLITLLISSDTLFWHKDTGVAQSMAVLSHPSRPACPTSCQYQTGDFDTPQWMILVMFGMSTPIPNPEVDTSTCSLLLGSAKPISASFEPSVQPLNDTVAQSYYLVYGPPCIQFLHPLNVPLGMCQSPLPGLCFCNNIF